MEDSRNSLYYEIPENPDSVVDHYVIMDLLAKQQQQDIIGFLDRPSEKTHETIQLSHLELIMGISKTLHFIHSADNISINDKTSMIFDILHRDEEKRIKFLAKIANVDPYDEFGFGYQSKDQEKNQQLKTLLESKIERTFYDDENPISLIVNIHTNVTTTNLETFFSLPAIIEHIRAREDKKDKLQRLAELGKFVAASAFGAFIGASLTRRPKR